MNRLVRAWLLTAVSDGIFASVLTLLYGRTVEALWQGVAAVPFGPDIVNRGAVATALGIAMHFCVALAWTIVLFVALQQSAWLRGVLASPGGFFKIAVVYGPMIWIIMSLVMVPLFTHKPPPVTWRWWLQMAGHVVFVASPMAWALRSRRE